MLAGRVQQQWLANGRAFYSGYYSTPGDTGNCQAGQAGVPPGWGRQPPGFHHRQPGFAGAAGRQGFQAVGRNDFHQQRLPGRRRVGDFGQAIAAAHRHQSGGRAIQPRRSAGFHASGSSGRAAFSGQRCERSHHRRHQSITLGLPPAAPAAGHRPGTVLAPPPANRASARQPSRPSATARRRFRQRISNGH